MPSGYEPEDQEDETEEETIESSEETTDETEESTEEVESDPKVAKRIKDFQSKADAAEARANKAEAALKIKIADKSNVSPETQALMQELKESSLDAVFGEYPLLKQYGIERFLIEGSTRAEMRESATSLVGLIKSVSTRVRNEVLTENGLSAESPGAARRSSVDYSTMDDEAFKKLLDSM